jgi:hypothetical protein
LGQGPLLSCRTLSNYQRKKWGKNRMRGERRRLSRRSLNRRGLGVGVRVARNAVYSVLRRVGVFMSGTGYRRRRHREYIGLRYRLVYVGAIAVLLRFVVMRLHVNEWSQRDVERAGRPEKEEGGLGAVAGARVPIRALALAFVPLWARVPGEWWEYSQREKVVDEMERRPERGQYRYTEGRKYVWLAGRVRRVSRMGAVVRTREEGGTKGRKGKGQRIGEQLSRLG